MRTRSSGSRPSSRPGVEAEVHGVGVEVVEVEQQLAAGGAEAIGEPSRARHGRCRADRSASRRSPAPARVPTIGAGARDVGGRRRRAWRALRGGAARWPISMPPPRTKARCSDQTSGSTALDDPRHGVEPAAVHGADGGRARARRRAGRAGPARPACAARGSARGGRPRNSRRRSPRPRRSGRGSRGSRRPARDASRGRRGPTTLPAPATAAAAAAAAAPAAAPHDEPHEEPHDDVADDPPDVAFGYSTCAYPKVERGSAARPNTAASSTTSALAPPRRRLGAQAAQPHEQPPPDRSAARGRGTSTAGWPPERPGCRRRRSARRGRARCSPPRSATPILATDIPMSTTSAAPRRRRRAERRPASGTRPRAARRRS